MLTTGTHSPVSLGLVSVPRWGPVWVWEQHQGTEGRVWDSLGCCSFCGMLYLLSSGEGFRRVLEGVQQRATEMMRDLEHLFYE